MKYFLALGISLSSAVSVAGDLYFYNCGNDKQAIYDTMEMGKMSKADAIAAFAQFNLNGNDPKPLFATLAQSHYNLTTINSNIALTVPKAIFDASTDGNKMMNFAFSCIFGYLYEISMGPAEFKAAMDANYQVPATDTLIEIKP